MPLGFNTYLRPKGFEGQVANIQAYRFIKGTQEEFTNGSGDYIPFGSLVIRDTTDPTKVTLPEAGETVIGVAILNDRFMAKTDNPRVTGFPPNETVPVLVKGVIYLVAETAVTRNGNLFVRVADEASPAANDRIGRVRADASGGNAEALTAGTYRVLEAAAAGEIVPVEFDLSPLL